MLENRSKKIALSVEETANLLGISRNSAYEAVRQGQIPSLKIGRRILIPRLALENLLSMNCKETDNSQISKERRYDQKII